MNEDFEKYLLQQDHDPSSKVDSSNLIKKMKKSQREEKAMKSKMQKLMRDTIEESAAGMKDAKQDLAEQDILAEDDKAEDIEEDVEEEDLPEDDFEQNKPENEEEDVHRTEKGAFLSEAVDNTEKLEKYEVKKTEQFEDGAIVNIVKKVKLGEEATDKSLQAVTEDANDDEKKEETITNREKNQSDRKSDRHDVREQSGKSEEDGMKLEKEEATYKSLQSITKDGNDDQKKEETRTNGEKNQRDVKSDREHVEEQSGKSEEKNGRKSEKDEKEEKKETMQRRIRVLENMVKNNLQRNPPNLKYRQLMITDMWYTPQKI